MAHSGQGGSAGVELRCRCEQQGYGEPREGRREMAQMQQPFRLQALQPCTGHRSVRGAPSGGVRRRRYGCGAVPLPSISSAAVRSKRLHVTAACQEGREPHTGAELAAANKAKTKNVLGASLLAAALAVVGATTAPGAKAVPSAVAGPGTVAPAMPGQDPSAPGVSGQNPGFAQERAKKKVVFTEKMLADNENPWWPRERKEQMELVEIFYDDLWRELKRGKVRLETC